MMGWGWIILSMKKISLNPGDLPVSHLHGYVGIVIGAAYHTKKLPVHKLKEFCSKIDHPVILLGGQQDHSKGSAEYLLLIL